MDSMLVGITEKQSARLAPNLAEPLASLADRWRVNQRHHLVEIAHQQAVKQGFICVLQVAQVGVALVPGFEVTQHLKTACRLIFKIANMWGKQSMQGEVRAFHFRERSSLVEHREVNQVETGEPGLQDSISSDAISHVSPACAVPIGVPL